MNNTERIVLKELTKSLVESTETNWSYGDIEEWSKFARRMRSVIETVTPVMEKLTSDANKDES